MWSWALVLSFTHTKSGWNDERKRSFESQHQAQLAAYQSRVAEQKAAYEARVAEARRKAEQRAAEQQAACDGLGAELLWGGFPDCDVAAGSRAVGLIEEVMAEVRPDIVYTHAPDDSHQDHRAVAEASISACRRVSRLCFYEGPTTTSFEPSR